MVWVMVFFEQPLTASLQVMGEQALIKPIKSKFFNILTMEDWELKIEIIHKILNEENNIAGTPFRISLKVRKRRHFPMTNLLNLNLSGCGQTGRNCNKGINK